MKNREIQILRFLANECKSNEYNVIEKKDIVSFFDKKNIIDENEIDAMISALERKGYIKIKYDDDNVYCLCVIHNDVEEKKESKTALFPSFLFNLLSAFLGSFIATLLVRIVFNI